MKNKLYIKTLLAAVLVVFTISSCKKSFYDINENPNDPADAAIEQLLPSAQGAIGVAVGNNFGIFGGLYAQYWTQSPNASQYKAYERYNPSADELDFPWAALYSDALEDLKFIEEKATVAKKPNYVAIAKVLRAYSYQLLTDNFGNVPLTEALKGDANPAILSPKYDPQQQVYDTIIANLVSAMDLMNLGDASVPGNDDIIFHGDMEGWYKFASTLLLRTYLRLSEVDAAKAQAGIAALEPNALFLGAGDVVQIQYTSAGGNTNPLYSEMSGLNFTQNLVASSTAINFYNQNSDPRVEAFYSPSPTGNFVGIDQGDYNVPASTDVAFPSTITGGYAVDDASATAPVIFMSAAESYFLQAEAAARGWLAAQGTAQELYEAGVTESFVSLGLEETDASDYYTQSSDSTRDVIAFPAAGSLQEQIKAIITQKWAAMCGLQNDEAWIEQRRTGYPDFFIVSKNAIIGGGQLPARLVYPNSELTFNSSFPGQPIITEKVWWDAN